MTSPAAIELTGARKAYGDRVVLDGITTGFAAGAITAMIGPSGGGKSTLLRAINGLTALDAGEVRVGGTVLAATASAGERRGAATAIRRSVGMIFQDFQLFPHLSALGNVMEAPVRVLGVARAEALARARALLDRVGLADHAGKFPAQLSGGQKQRVAIARALAMRPRALLCDEITSALDPEIKHEVLSVLESLRGEGLAILMVTHEIGFARRAADRVLLLDGGRVAADGAPGEVIDRPPNERAAQFLSRVLG